jgi:molybdopterin-guanine dinucleotide biosynthesis protein A
VTDSHAAITLAILVGGQGRRMGFVAKGNLPSPESDGRTLTERLAREAAGAGLSRVVLVGDARAYTRMGLEVIDDRAEVRGPLAGLAGLCDREAAPFVLVACDMPSVSAALLARVARGSERSAVLAAREPDGRWQPMCAWYYPTRVRVALDEALADGVRSFQGLFARLAIEELSLSERERGELEDWDTPEDMRRR